MRHWWRKTACRYGNCSIWRIMTVLSVYDTASKKRSKKWPKLGPDPENWRLWLRKEDFKKWYDMNCSYIPLSASICSDTVLARGDALFRPSEKRRDFLRLWYGRIEVLYPNNSFIVQNVVWRYHITRSPSSGVWLCNFGRYRDAIQCKAFISSVLNFTLSHS